MSDDTPYHETGAADFDGDDADRNKSTTDSREPIHDNQNQVTTDPAETTLMGDGARRTFTVTNDEMSEVAR